MPSWFTAGRVHRFRGRSPTSELQSTKLAPLWEEEHHIEIAVAQVDAAGSVLVRSELLSCWPYRYDELEVELRRVGLRTEMSTFNPEAENYMVVASKG